MWCSQIGKDTVKLVVWFDNEAGFAARIVDLVLRFKNNMNVPKNMCMFKNSLLFLQDTFCAFAQG